MPNNLQNGTKRKLAAQLLTIAFLVPLIAACGGTSAPATGEPTAAPVAAEPTSAPAAEQPAAPTAEPTAAPEEPAAAEPTSDSSSSDGNFTRGQGGTLNLLWWQAPTILNFHLGQGTKDSDASRLILEPLAAIGPDGNPVPVLAAEIPTIENGGVSADLKEVTWKLKQDVVWSDGTPFTSADVVFTYDYCIDPDTACTTGTAFQGAEKVEALDDYTVKITWLEPNPNPYQMFVSTLGQVLQKAQFQNCIGSKASTDSACQAANNAPIGTGPYKLREFKPGDVVVYDMNENYRDPNKPFFKEVQLKGGGDATSAARAVFQTGDTDYAWNLQVEAAVLEQLQQGGQGELLTIFGSSLERLVINFTDVNPDLGDERGELTHPHPFLTDLNVRRALAMAIDRKTMADQLYGPAGTATCEVVTTLPYIDPADIYGGRNKCEPDIEGAKKLLDDAGWVPGPDGIRQKDGVRLSLTYSTTVNPLRQKEQALVKAAWEQLGVEVELKSIDASVFFSSDAGNPDTFGHFFNDIQMYTNNYEQPDPTNYLCGWTTVEIAAKANEWRGNNNGRYSNPEYDELCEQLRRTTNLDERKEIVLKMNDILVNDVVVIPLVARAQVTSGKSKDLKGINLTPWDSELWNIAEWYK
jgi:ABC-type dipeptide transport system, periplasmic component